MFIFLTRLGRLFVGAVAVVAVTSIFGLNTLTTVPVASHHQPAGTADLKVVLLNSTDGQPHYGQAITFNVSTSATSYPNVNLNCYKNGTLVLSWTAGFFPSYLWTKNVTLSSPSWTGGEASCQAKLFYSSGKKIVTLATLDFQVSP